VFVVHTRELDCHAEEFVLVFMKGRCEGVLMHENEVGTRITAHACEVWKFLLYDRSIPKPPVPPAGKDGRESEEDNLKKEIADLCSAAKGSGYKASVGSRDVRGEWTIWYKDSDTASSKAKNWKEKEWIKDDEKSPPRWWKSVAGKSGGGKTAENALRDGLSFRSSGETFTIKASLETKTLKDGVSGLLQAFIGGSRGGMSAPNMPGGLGGGPPGRPQGGGPPGGIAPPVPGATGPGTPTPGIPTPGIPTPGTPPPGGGKLPAPGGPGMRRRSRVLLKRQLQTQVS